MNFVFKIISVYPQWWIIPKLSSFFWREETSMKRTFLQKMISLFYHRSSLTSLITMSFKEVGRKKIFHENIFFWNVIFCKCCHQSCVFHWYNILKPSTFLWKWLSMEKTLAKTSFFFFNIGPLYPHWKLWHSKKHSRKNFSLKVFSSQKQSFIIFPVNPP